jgi:uncharacterized protein
VLSRFDVEGSSDLLVYSCEDCACPVSEYHDTGNQPAAQLPSRRPAPSAVENGRWVRASDVTEFPLDDNYWVLFNPLGTGGVVVVNRPAYEVFHALAQPTALTELIAGQPPKAGPSGETAETADAAQTARTLGELARLELVHPDGQPCRPRFADSQTLTAWLHVTNGCNLRCPYCYVRKSPDAMDEDCGRAAVEAVIKSAVANGFSAVKLKYAGGEASLNHRLVVKLHEYAVELAAASGLGLHATLLSNGVKLPASLVAVCRAAGIRIMISLDGIGDQHDIQRPFANGRPSFGFVRQTIDELIAAGVPPHLSVTVTGRNAAGVADVVRFALEQGLTFSINLFRDNDCASAFGDLRYEEDQIIRHLLEAFEVVEQMLPPWSVLGAILDRGQLIQPRQRSCGVGQDYVVIDQHGQVAKCHMEIERTLGDVFTSDPLRLVREDRTILNLLSDEKEGCRDCTWRYWCSGGCSVATFRATGRFDVKSPNCAIYKAIYPRALRLEALRLLRYGSRQ